MMESVAPPQLGRVTNDHFSQDAQNHDASPPCRPVRRISTERRASIVVDDLPLRCHSRSDSKAEGGSRTTSLRSSESTIPTTSSPSIDIRKMASVSDPVTAEQVEDCVLSELPAFLRTQLPPEEWSRIFSAAAKSLNSYSVGATRDKVVGDQNASFQQTSCQESSEAFDKSMTIERCHDSEISNITEPFQLGMSTNTMGCESTTSIQDDMSTVDESMRDSTTRYSSDNRCDSTNTYNHSVVGESTYTMEHISEDEMSSADSSASAPLSFAASSDTATVTTMMSSDSILEEKETAPQVPLRRGSCNVNGKRSSDSIPPRYPKRRSSLINPENTRERRTSSRSVEFGRVEIRQYQQILEVNPSTSSGPSVGIGWQYLQQAPVTLGAHEASRRCPMNNTGCRVLRREARETILRKLGYKDREIAKAVRECLKIKHQRKQTYLNLRHERVEYLVETSKRKVGQLLRPLKVF